MNRIDPKKIQGSYGSWKTWKVLEFYYGTFQDWKDLGKKATGPGKFWKSIKLIKCMEGSHEGE